MEFKRRRMGVHTSIAGGLPKALLRARDLGCSTVQVFSHSPRVWRTGDLRPGEAGAFRALKAELDIDPVFVHASYLINICSASSDVREKSVLLLREEMRRASAIGAQYVILHFNFPGGSWKGSRKCVFETLGRADVVGAGDGGGALLLLENTSVTRHGGGREFAAMSEVRGAFPGLVGGICLDTCHAFASGYDIRRDKGLLSLERDVTKYLGRGGVRLVHLNDSKSEAGSGVDRHEHIGKGRIGSMALGAFLSAGPFSSAPVIIETPKKDPTDDPRNLRALARLIN